MVTTWCWCDRHFLRWKMGLERCVLEWPGWRNPLRGSRWRPPSRWVIGSWVMVRQGKYFFSGWETLGGGTRERHWSQKWDGATCGVDSFRHTTTRRARICGSSRDKCTVTQLYVNREILVYMLIIQHDNKMTLQFQYLLEWHLGWKRYQLGGGGGVETCKGIVLVSPGSADTQWSMWLDISTLKVMLQHCRFLHILKFCNLNG